MPRVAAILGFSAVLILCWGDLTSVSARSPRKFDEFAKLNHCDMAARLDNLAVVVSNEPESETHIMVYAPPGAGEAILKLIKDYLINTRGLAKSRIKTFYGGRNRDPKEPLVQLWIFPRGTDPIEPERHETDVDTFNGLLADDRVGDSIDLQTEDEMGPGIPGTTNAAFADILNQQKNAVGYLVVYSGDDATPGAWRRIADDQLDYLKKHFKLDSSRVKVIFGGHQKEIRRQLWILPKNASPPVPDAGPESPMAKAVNIGDFDAYCLGNKQNEANVLKRLKQVLEAQKTVRAYLVVRLQPPTPYVADTHETREPADLTTVVEKWRIELANTHKIGADRFVVIFTTGPASEPSHLSLWIVPKGHPLPDQDENTQP